MLVAHKGGVTWIGKNNSNVTAYNLLLITIMPWLYKWSGKTAEFPTNIYDIWLINELWYLMGVWAPLVFKPSSPHYILVAVGYHLNAALHPGVALTLAHLIVKCMGQSTQWENFNNLLFYAHIPCLITGSWHCSIIKTNFTHFQQI